jgi:hypothetical protein
VKISLDCFNSRDGTGLFSGVSRYSALVARIEISAVQADSLTRFWALLLKRMQWPVPPKRADQRIVDALSHPDKRGVLLALATEATSIVTLARMLHDEDKQSARELREEQREPHGEADHVDHDLNDELF